jgi:fibronectin type 3 domain-containing protein
MMNYKKYRLAGFLLRGIAFALFLSLTLFSTCRLFDDDDAQNQNPVGNTPQVTPDPVLPTPNAPIVTASDSSLTLRWDAVEGAEKYYVYVYVYAYASQSQQLLYATKTVTETTTVLTGLSNGLYYYVCIKAVNSSGSSNFSPYARGLPWSTNNRPADPGTLVIIPGIYQLTINWEECGGASSYEVYISTSNTRPNSSTRKTYTTSAVINNLENDVLYYVWVGAVNRAGTSYSPVASGTPQAPTTAPTSPNSPELIAGSHEITVRLQAVEGTTAYEVWFGTSDNSAQAQKYGSDITGGLTETVITGLENNTPYYVWIKAKNPLGTSDFSPSANAKPSVFGAIPLPPEIPSVSFGNGQVTVTWTETEGALAYEVYMGTNNNPSYATKIGEYINAELSATIDGLSNGNTYYFWIKAKNDVGTSEFNSAVSVKTIANATKPTLDASNERLYVTWTTIAGADYYEVFCGTDVTPPQSAKQTASSTSSTINGLVNGTMYNVWVRGKNSTGTGAISGVASAKPIGMGTVTLVSGNGQLTVNWSAVAGADEYEVYYGTSTTPTTLATTTIGTTATISGLIGGETYYVRLRAKNSNGFSDGPTTSGIPNTGCELYRGTEKIVFQDFASALSWISTNAVSGDSFKIILGASEYISSSKSLDYSGKTVGITLLGSGSNKSLLNANVNGSMFTVSSGVTLTLDENISLVGFYVNVSNGGFLIMNEGAKITGSYVSVGSSGTFTMSGGEITGGGVSVGSGTFTMSGGEISGNSGSGVSVGSGTFTMSGGKISGNTASYKKNSYGDEIFLGGGVYVDSGTFTMNGGEISGNNTFSSFYGNNGYGGGVYVDSGTFTMSGGKISGNTASSTKYSYGGGVYVSHNGTFTMNGGEISGNTASSTSPPNFSCGGGVYVVVGVDSGTFTKSGGGIITGYTSDTVNGNVVKTSSGVVQSDRGHAVYCNNGMCRETTAGPTVNLDSSKSGAEGGWEN